MIELIKDNKFLNKEYIILTQKNIISLVEYLIRQIKNSKKEKLTYFELLKYTKNKYYQNIENTIIELTGETHYLSVLDGIFETDNKELSKCDYSMKMLKKKDNKMSSIILIQSLKTSLEYMNTSYIKDEISLYKS